MKVSCDICKYGTAHDYVRGNYYCGHPDNPRNSYVDAPKVCNCDTGVLDQIRYNLKYKPFKKDVNVTKDLVHNGLNKILWAIRLKNVEDIITEIDELKTKVDSYREPNKCETCALDVCDDYAAGCRNCSKWK